MKSIKQINIVAILIILLSLSVTTNALPGMANNTSSSSGVAFGLNQASSTVSDISQQKQSDVPQQEQPVVTSVKVLPKEEPSVTVVEIVPQETSYAISSVKPIETVRCMAIGCDPRDYDNPDYIRYFSIDVSTNKQSYNVGESVTFRVKNNENRPVKLGIMDNDIIDTRTGKSMYWRESVGSHSIIIKPKETYIFTVTPTPNNIACTGNCLYLPSGTYYGIVGGHKSNNFNVVYIALPQPTQQPTPISTQNNYFTPTPPPTPQSTYKVPPETKLGDKIAQKTWGFFEGLITGTVRYFNKLDGYECNEAMNKCWKVN